MHTFWDGRWKRRCSKDTVITNFICCVFVYGTVSGVKLVLIDHNWEVFFVKLEYRNGYRKRAAAIGKHNFLNG